MKRKFTKLKMLVVALFATGFAFAGGPASHVQIFHNCADPAADTVSVFVDFGAGQTSLLPSLAFRNATPFVDVGSQTTFTVHIKAKGSNAASPSLYSEVLGPLAPDSSYIVVASGVVGSGFASNPNSVNTGFDLKVIAPARRAALNAGKVDFAVFHGATDAPAVDVNLSGGATLVAGAQYADASGYLEVNPTWYPIDIAVAGTSTVVASYIADLSSLSGDAAVVFASGFLTPSANNNGPAFGLFAVLANGTVIELPAQQTANVQVVHNCADPLADSVDVYLDGTLLLDNFKFRTATPFVSVIAGYPHSIAVAPPTSTSVAQALATFPVTLTAGENYTVFASGTVGTGFSVNPDSRSIAFDLKIVANAQTAATNNTKVDFAIFHGVTDAPGVDVKISGGGATLASNARYGDATGYLSVDPTWYPIDILPAGGSTAVAAYVADLSSLTGGAAIVFASGFLVPSLNNSGPAFGIYAVLADGTVIQLPAQQKAQVQVLHNCADPIADSVDVYINGALALDNFPFRTATPFISLVSGYPNTVAIAPKNSTSAANAVWTRDYTLAANTNYILTASGLIGSGFAANPGGHPTAFDVLVKTPAQTQAVVSTNFDFFAIHGATDAPTVDVVANGALTVVDNAYYGAQTGYLPVPAGSYTLAVTDSTGANTVATYVADLTSLASKSGVVLASGFLNPAANNNGSAFGLWVALPEGGPFIPLALYNSIADVSNEIGLNMFPNPNNGLMNINFNLPQTENVSIQIVDMSGRVVKDILNNSALNGKQNIVANLNDLSNGLYMARITTANKTAISKFTLAK
jgi:hypothetical protein